MNNTHYRTETARRIQGPENSHPTYVYTHGRPYGRLQDNPKALHIYHDKIKNNNTQYRTETA